MSDVPPVSSKYLGESGLAYFNHYRLGSEVGGRLNAAKFSSLVGKSDVVLDFGCGGGWTLKNLECARRIGVEVNPAAASEAAANGVEVHPSVDALPSGSIDVVISNHALEHVASPLDVLYALRERLRPGGLLVICVPIDDWRTQNRVETANMDQHLYTWTPLLFGNLLLAAGFQKPTIEVLTQAWPPGWRHLARLPAPLFRALCFMTAVATRHREMIAVAAR